MPLGLGRQCPEPSCGVVGQDALPLEMLLRVAETMLPGLAVSFAVDDQFLAVVTEVGKQAADFRTELRGGFRAIGQREADSLAEHRVRATVSDLARVPAGVWPRS